MTDVRLTDEYLEAVDELRAVAAGRAILDDREAAAKQLLLKLLAAGDTGTDSDGTPLVAIRTSRRFDPKKAAAVLPGLLGEEGYAALCTTTTAVDPRKAKDVLAPALWQLCTNETSASVVLK